MADVTVKTIGEMEKSEGGGFHYAGRSLGVSAWGMNVETFSAGWDGYPEHDHEGDGQEEVYVPIEGSVTLTADGQSWELTPGTMARVGAGQKRKVIPGPDGVTMVVLGGTPGKAYETKQG
jgi:mannose-6-phosphate isomerase-like protein (cupin superfamily)